VTLVTAQTFYFTDLCPINEENENNLQIHADVHFVHCNRFFNCINRKLFKQIKMKKNMSSADRIIRLIISAIMVTLYFTNIVGGTVGIILLVLSGVFTLTSIISFCPLYAIFGISTCPVKQQ
jgi:hypothetical protein